MQTELGRASRMFATCAILTVALSSCAGSRTASTIVSDAPPGTPVISFPNSPDVTNRTSISANSFAQQAGVSGTALTVTTIDNGEAAYQLTVDLMGNVGVRGHFVSLLGPAPASILDATPDAETLLDALPVRVYRLASDPRNSLPRIGAVNSVASGAASPTQPVTFDLTTSVAVDVAATKQLIREVAELKAEVAALKRQVGER